MNSRKTEFLLSADPRLSQPFLSREAARVAYAGHAVYDGCITLALWPRDAVLQFLPEPLELVDAEGEPDVHPVLFIFGQQRETALILGGIPNSS
jgi:hypothetical protein